MAKAKKVKESPAPTKKLGAVKKKKEVFAFSVEIISSGVVYKADGNDLYVLLRDFPMPALVKTETNIAVTKNGRTVQKDLKVADARRCFTGYDTTSLELLAIGLTKMLP